MARCVDAVSEQHYGFSTFDRFELFLQDVVNGVVETRASSSACVANGSCDLVSIYGRPALNLNSIVERHHHHLVSWLELIDEFNCGVLDIAETEFRGTARVDQQDDTEWRVGSGKVSDLLFDAVFLNAKVFTAEKGDVMAVSVHDLDRHHHQRGIKLDGVAFDSFAIRADARFSYTVVGSLCGFGFILFGKLGLLAFRLSENVGRQQRDTQKQ